MKRTHLRAQRGYNLIEVLVAMALLGVVMLAIASLFVWGRKNVYSGKQMTAAIAVGTRALEDLAPLTKEDVYNGVFNIAGTEIGKSFDLGAHPKKSYANARIRSTKATLITGMTDIQDQKTGGPKFLDKWNDQLYHDPLTKKQARLLDGAVSVIMIPHDPSLASGSTPTFAAAPVLKLRVIVSWSENNRPREVILDTSKTN